jgi:sulfate permease, SulP family
MSQNTESKRRLPVLQGILPIRQGLIPADIAAGVTLAALGIPEVMGYTSIAGMPVITGLYTILIPIAVFALLGSSRHLVVGADSATAAIMAAGLAGMAAVASTEYVALAGMLAIITGGMLILARVIRLGFIADFLSRSVLVGFLTGVGIQVAMGQIGDMLGIPAQSGGTIQKFFATLGDFSQRNATTILVSAGVLAVILGAKLISPKIPGALIAVVGAIFVSWRWDLAGDGVATLGVVPGGLPTLAIPSVSWSEFTQLFATAGALFIVILAQSAATSRAYASKHQEQFDENVDLVGLGLANASAGLSGTFVVNGSPTKSQMVEGAGGRSQLAMLTTAVIVLIVLLFFTAPLQYMPSAVLASVVFLIGVELIDIPGMRLIMRGRFAEFIIATLTATVVVVVGVEQAIVLAIILSVIDHLRHSYHPNDTVVTMQDDGHLKSVPAADGGQLKPGLVVYRFGASLYYANSSFFNEQILGLVDDADPPVKWLVIDAAAITDVDFTGAAALEQVSGELDSRGVRLIIAQLSDPVRTELDRYGVTDAIGANAYFDTPGAAVDAFAAEPDHGQA